MNIHSKIFVAGHNGMVGSSIVRTLRAKGYKNIIVRGRQELDLSNQVQTTAFFKKEKPEYVFLSAAKVGGIVANNVYRASFIYQNIMIEANVIHASHLYGVKKLLFLGSTCIYPKHAPQPMPEDSLLTSPLEYTNEPYAIAKIAGIKMCESYNIEHGTNFVSVMPTNLYGYNDNFDLEKSHVLPALIRKIHLAKLLKEGRMDEVISNLQMKTKEKAEAYLSSFGVSGDRVEIWGTGTPKREFLFVDDMAAACVYVMESVDATQLQTTDEVRNTHINIGTGTDVSIKELAVLIKEIIGYEGELYFNTDRPDGTPRKLTDCTKIHELGWSHKVSLAEGIRKTYEWYTSSSER